MGGRLATHVVTLGFMGHLDGLSRPAWAVLMTMATVARDAPASRPGLYFGGWEYLAKSALRYPEYTPAAKRTVARCLAELTDAGLIKTEGRETFKRQAYRLTLPEAIG